MTAVKTAQRGSGILASCASASVKTAATVTRAANLSCGRCRRRKSRPLVWGRRLGFALLTMAPVGDLVPSPRTAAWRSGLAKLPGSLEGGGVPEPPRAGTSRCVTRVACARDRLAANNSDPTARRGTKARVRDGHWYRRTGSPQAFPDSSGGAAGGGGG